MYKFKVELTAWAINVALCVLSMLVLLTLRSKPDMVYWTAAEQFRAEHMAIMQGTLIVVLAILWALVTWVFRILRRDSRYGER